jgi:hypothetical protein
MFSAGEAKESIYSPAALNQDQSRTINSEEGIIITTADSTTEIAITEEDNALLQVFIVRFLRISY